MKVFGRIINPLITFIAVQLIWILLVVLWIYWFMGAHRKFRDVAEKYSPELLQGGVDWVILFEGLLLLVAILVGVYVIFLFWSRQAALYRAQKNFISQVTHELKSPVASLQLHLETIRRRRPSVAKMDVFIDTMLADSERLNNLIDNLLSAHHLEQRTTLQDYSTQNFSQFIERYFGSRQYSLPHAGTMELSVEPDLYASFDPDMMETVLRNLLENAILYSDGAPRITVRLQSRAKYALLVVADRGRGIAREHQRKVFNMFYRVKPQDKKSVRGSGLGLFIVGATVRRFKGKVWLESAGEGQGTAVYIELPLRPKGERDE